MATSSIFHDFVIGDEESAERLADILTSPKPEPRKQSFTVRWLSQDEIKKIFLGDDKNAR